MPASLKKKPAAPALSRQSMRSETTRKALLEAARKVFARDGFVAARIEDIAAEAGRSRGAFYANFSDKEEAFFALRQQAMEEYETEVGQLLSETLSPDEQRVIFEDWVSRRIPQKGQILLQLEFKLFAMRHPLARRKLMEQHLRKLCKVELAFFEGKLPSIHSEVTAEQQRRMLLFEAVIEALALSHNFSPELMTSEYIRKALPCLFDAVLSCDTPAAGSSGPDPAPDNPREPRKS